MVIESAVFSRPTWMYMEDGVIEVNLPEWSGRMDKRYALAELANLKAFIAKVESVLNGPTVRTPRDFTPSERAEVVAEAVAEDEASDSPDLTESEGLAAYEDEMWEYVREVAEAAAAEADEKTPVELWEEWYLHDDGEEWEDDWYDASDQNWYYMDAPPPPQPINHAGRRADYKAWRHNAIFFGGNLPYVPCFGLAANIATFEGEVYRVIDPRDLNTNDIPF